MKFLKEFIVVCFVVSANCEYVGNFNYLQLPHYEMIKTAVEVLPDAPCTRDLKRYIDALQTYERWSMIMFDSTVKFPYGLLHGNSYQMGNYDECIKANVPENGTIPSFTGQYCLAEISVNQPKQRANLTEEEIFKHRKLFRDNRHVMHWALCVPSTCPANFTQAFVREIFARIMPARQLNITVTENDCNKSYEMSLSSGSIAFCVALGVFLIVILVATTYHCCYVLKRTYFMGYQINRRREQFSLKHEIILSFSAIRNIRKLLEIRAKNNDYNLDCICGIRAISMAFILAGHALTFLTSSPSLNQGFTHDAIKKIQNAMFVNNPLLVDSFLLVSGFLMCRLLLVELDRVSGKLNIFAIYIGRYIRLTPAYLVVIGFYCTFMVDIGDGPLWKKRMTLEQERCLNSWWTNLAYINNYVNTDQLCMFQSWYLSVDTQLFIIAPLIVFPLWYKAFIGEIILASCCIISVVVPFVLTNSKSLDPTLMIYPEEINDLSSNYYFKHYYIKTHMRANAYLMGMMFGYIVHKMQFLSTKIPFIARILVGVLAIMTGASAMFSVVVFYQDDYVYSALEAAAYASLHRLAWCFAIGWTLIVCVTASSYVNNFLSWRAWGPFSKLSYCAYLVNGIVELYSYGQTRTPRYLSIYSLGSETAAHIVMTLILAFILCVLFESPIHSLEKLLLRGRKTKTSPSPGINNNDDDKSNCT